jgi:hypothetical protein
LAQFRALGVVSPAGWETPVPTATICTGPE